MARCRFLGGEITRDGWIGEQETILAERRGLAAREPPSPRFQDGEAMSAAILSGLLLDAGRPAEALTCVNRVLPDYEHFVRAEQEHSKAAAKVESVVGNSFNRVDFWSNFNLVLSHLQAAVIPVELENSKRSRLSALLLAHRAAALAGVDRMPEGAKAIRQAIDMTDGLVRGGGQVRCPPTTPASAWSFLAEELYWREPCYLYDLACQLALASTLPGDAGLADPAGRAVRALRDYVVSGFDNPYKLRNDPALEPLRQRGDFQKLLSDLETKIQGARKPAEPVNERERSCLACNPPRILYPREFQPCTPDGERPSP